MLPSQKVGPYSTDSLDNRFLCLLLTYYLGPEKMNFLPDDSHTFYNLLEEKKYLLLMLKLKLLTAFFIMLQLLILRKNFQTL